MNEGDHGNKTSSTRTSTLSKTIDFIKRSQLEPLIIGYDFSSALRNVATQQLIQDKICLRSYTESNDYCHLLSQANNSDTKEQIVAQVSQYLGYKELLIVIPSILSALFIGSWCDRFLNGKRYCMLSTTFSQFLENVFLLLNAYYFGADALWTIFSFLIPAFFGNGFGFYTAVYAYTATEVPKYERALRYIVIAVIRNLAMSAGYFVGGIIISRDSLIGEEQLQNYGGTFIVAAGISFFCFCWTFLFVRPKGLFADMASSSHDNNIESRTAMLRTLLTSSSSSSSERQPILKPVEGGNSRSGISSVIGYKNIVQIWKTVSQNRPGTERLRMWVMIWTINMTLLPEFGKNAVIYPLVQKLYKWDSVMYSELVTYRELTHVVAVILVIPVMFKIFQANDCQTAMIGVVSGVIADVLIGSIMTPWGFYLHAGISSLYGLSGTGIRAYLSKLLPGDEVSQIFSVVLMIEAVCNCFAAVSFSMIFQLTIHSYATFVFHFMGFILIVSLIALVWVDLKTPYHL